MLSWILHHAGRQPNFLIGGVAENFGRSFGLGGGDEFVLEGDEYDSAFFDKAPKFLHYHPQEAIITSLEFDHADIYDNLAAIELQFRRMVNLVPRSGRIVAWGESETVRGVVQKAFCPVETYGFTPGVDWLAGDLEITDGETRFRVSRHGNEVARVKMSLAGRHNVLNAVAAIAIAHGRGVSGDVIADAMAEFRGVLRRLEVKGELFGVLVVDDFAHHPTAIRATIDAALHRWPGRRLWAVFEPRSNTMRRKVFENDLAASLATADATILGAVNRANLLSDEDRMSPSRVLETIRSAGRKAEGFDSAEEIAEYLAVETRPGDLVLVMSNGSFDGLCGKLLGKLQERGAPAGKFKA
jgi:UDP-N-acetylmuramate: L-alanyl-gamma-D-glutamyl-meso-diaminopimelate ligase